MRQEDALLVIVGWLRDDRPGSPLEYPRHGYDLYLPTLICWYLRNQSPRSNPYEEDSRLTELFSIFADAAWELCRRGILRPGVSEYNAQVTAQGSGGSGFSVTKF